MAGDALDMGRTWARFSTWTVMLESVEEVDMGEVSRAAMAIEMYRGRSRGDGLCWGRQGGDAKTSSLFWRLADLRRSRSNTAKVHTLQATNGPQDV